MVYFPWAVAADCPDDAAVLVRFWKWCLAVPRATTAVVFIEEGALGEIRTSCLLFLLAGKKEINSFSEIPAKDGGHSWRSSSELYPIWAPEISTKINHNVGCCQAYASIVSAKQLQYGYNRVAPAVPCRAVRTTPGLPCNSGTNLYKSPSQAVTVVANVTFLRVLLPTIIFDQTVIPFFSTLLEEG